jgi:hypothetical protein
MNEIYKIDLDNIEEYNYLINDNDMLKIFSTHQFDNRLLYKNENEYILNDRLDRIQINYHTNNTNNINMYQNSKIEKYKNQQKEFSPKKIEMKIPLESYSFKKLKIFERLKIANKNIITRSFALPNRKDENFLKNKINKSINKNNNNQNNDILSKSNNNMNINDFLNLENIIKQINKNKTIKLDVKNNNKQIESYNIQNVNNRYKNSIPFSNDINLKDFPEMHREHYFNKSENEKEMENKQNLDIFDIIIRNDVKSQNRNKKSLNFNKKLNTVNKSVFSYAVNIRIIRWMFFTVELS